MGKLSEQIIEVNNLGRENLAEKGVNLPENATTYEIMQSIADISSGGGMETTIEYIESTGTQYIDTGIIPTNHRVKMKFQCTTSDGANLFGSYGDKSNSDNYNVYELVWYSGRWYYAPNSRGAQGSFPPTFYPTDVVELDFNTYDNKIIMNDTTVAATYGNSRAVYPLYLFERNGAVGDSPKMKLWYAQIYDRTTEELVRDFVPAIDENGVICLYDSVTKAYFYNQGEGEFISGLVENELIEIENLIDESEVLDSTEGTVTEKVKKLIDKAKSGSSPSIDENGIVTFGATTSINENGIVNL